MNRRFINRQSPEHVGEIRQSQIVSTFGVGSIVDFVNHTVIISGTDNWDSDSDKEKRMLFNNNLQDITGKKYFLEPKTADNKYLPHYPYQKKSPDVEAYIFPRKLYCPVCKHILDVNELGNKKNLRCIVIRNGKKCNSRLVPSRFVLVCPNGHIEDFPYEWWVHGKEMCENPRMKMYNIDNRSDIDSLVIECETCHKKEKLMYAFSNLKYPCNGKHPHLGKNYNSACDELMRVRLRSSSNVYFPAILSALTIPPWSRKAVQLIETSYETLIDFEEYGENAVKKHIENRIYPKAQGLTLTDLLEAYKLVKKLKAKKKMTEAEIYASEYDVLCKGEMDDDDYVASSVQVPEQYKQIIDSITVVDKLTVINVLVGFTRINSWNRVLKNNVQLAPLSKTEKEWLPAVKLLGEGIFFQFNNDAITNWVNRIGNRYLKMRNELDKSFFNNDRFSAQYVALHTFAHLLIRQLSIECGYNIATLKEKIYSTFVNSSNPYPMHGVLIYLSTSDSEGSLGGLISIANDTERLNTILVNMLNKALWCSADPVCCNLTDQGYHSLNYAACHDCVLLPETSCEFANVLLDRVAIIGKPENPNLGLMGDIAASLINK